jgi:hypothetical protein
LRGEREKKPDDLRTPGYVNTPPIEGDSRWGDCLNLSDPELFLCGAGSRNIKD